MVPLRYDKMFQLLKEKGLKKYDLRKDKVISMSALESMRTGKHYVDTRTIEYLCVYLHCQPGDLMEYVPEEQETSKGASEE